MNIHILNYIVYQSFFIAAPAYAVVHLQYIATHPAVRERKLAAFIGKSDYAMWERMYSKEHRNIWLLVLAASILDLVSRTLRYFTDVSESIKGWIVIVSSIVFLYALYRLITFHARARRDATGKPRPGSQDDWQMPM